MRACIICVGDIREVAPPFAFKDRLDQHNYIFSIVFKMITNVSIRYAKRHIVWVNQSLIKCKQVVRCNGAASNSLYTVTCAPGSLVISRFIHTNTDDRHITLTSNIL